MTRRMVWMLGAFLAGLVFLLGLVSCQGNAGGGYRATGGRTPLRGDLIKYIPENTDFLLYAANAKETDEKISNSPYGKLLAHEGFEALAENLKSKTNVILKHFRSQMGFELKDFVKLFDGEAAISVLNLDGFLDKISEVAERGSAREAGLLEFVFVAQINENPTNASKYMDKLLKKIKENAPNFSMKWVPIEGEKVVVFGQMEAPKLYYTQVNNLFLLTSSKTTLREILKNTQKGLEKTIANNAHFNEVASKVGGGDFLVYLDTRPIMRFINKKFDKKMEEDPTTQRNTGILRKFINDTLGMGNVTGMAGGGTITATGSSFDVFVATKGDLKGILKSIAGSRGSLEPPKWSPIEAITFHISHVDVVPLYSDLQETISSVVEVLREQQKKMMEQEGEEGKKGKKGGIMAVNPIEWLEAIMGFKIKEDFINNLGMDWIGYTLEKSEGDSAPPSVSIVSLKDEKAISRVLRKISENPLLVYISPEKEDYKNTTIYTANFAERKLSVAVYQKYLISAQNGATTEIVKDLIDNFGGRAKSFGNNPDFSALKSEVLSGATMLSYEDGGALYDAIDGFKNFPKKLPANLPFGQMLQGFKMEKWQEFRTQLMEGIDWEKLPQRDYYTGLFYGSVSSVAPGSDGIFMHTYTKFREGVHKKAKQE